MSQRSLALTRAAEEGALWIVLGLTPLYIWFNYLAAAKPDEAATIPWFQMVVGSVAFVIWSLSVPGSPFEDEVPIVGGTLSAQDGVIVTIVGSLVLAFLVTGRPSFKKFRDAWRARRQKPDPRPPV